MFVETVTLARAEAETVWEHSRLFSEPPDGLAAAIAWMSGADEVTVLMAWDTAAARGDFALERMVPLYEAGTLTERHGRPAPVDAVNAYVRT
jgi:hypothetical protein